MYIFFITDKMQCVIKIVHFKIYSSKTTNLYGRINICIRIHMQCPTIYCLYLSKLL